MNPDSASVATGVFRPCEGDGRKTSAVPLSYRTKIPHVSRVMTIVEPNVAPEAFEMDALLVAVGRNRDKGAFQRLFDYFAPRLKAYVMRLGAADDQAEELVQEAMLMVWCRAETYDPAQARASTWMFTIARNKRIDAIRKAKRPEPDMNDPSFMPEEVRPADRFVEALQDEKQVRDALKTLPDEQAELIQQVYFQDKSHRVIAAETGLPLGTVKSRIRLALKKMRLVIEEEENAGTSS